MAQAKVIERPVTVYSGPAPTEPVVELPVGAAIELGSAKNGAGGQWVFVSLPDGKRGYVPGDTKVFRVKPASLLQDEVEVHAAPSAGSGVIVRLRKNARFDLTDQVPGEGGNWVRVRDSLGNEGFIDGKTRVNTGGAAGARTSKEVAQKNMVVGTLWCVGGSLITAITYSSASESGGTYFVMWGAIIFGGWQFLKGLFQYLGEA
jgi:hypothetical protein